MAGGRWVLRPSFLEAAVRGAFAIVHAAPVLTEICLCHARSCEAMEDMGTLPVPGRCGPAPSRRCPRKITSGGVRTPSRSLARGEQGREPAFQSLKKTGGAGLCGYEIKGVGRASMDQLAHAPMISLDGRAELM
eukprot:COSAG01_NODE_170_length_23136_cov_24.853931_11_plen_134_part_00